MKKKPKLTDFSKEREKKIKRHYVIEYVVGSLFSILLLAGVILYDFIVGYDSPRDESLRGFLYIYFGVVLLVGFLFGLITWKVLGWENISPSNFEIHEMTGVSHHDRQELKQSDLETLIALWFIGIIGFILIIIGIVKLF